jgi:hypothetical protein
MTPVRFYALVRAWFPARVRLWLNSVALAVCGVLVVHGYLTGREAAAWTVLVAAVLVTHRAGLRGDR